jgi:hypothetical protein
LKSKPREAMMRETSLEAFEGIKAGLPEKRMKVLDAIGKTGSQGATLFELVKILERPVNEISGRVTELAEGELIIDTGRRVNPDTERAATVWIITPAGILLLHQS